MSDRMLNVYLAVLALVCLVLLALGGMAHSADLTPGAALSKMQDQMFAPSVQIGKFCSGTIVYSAKDPKGEGVKTIILTAKHCTGAAGEYEVRVPVYQHNVIVQWQTYVALVTGKSYSSDVAVIVLRDQQTVFPYVAKLAPGTVSLIMGEAVWTVGYPQGRPLTVTSGMFGSVESIDYPSAGSQYYRATPDAAPGNSGGGLFHLNEDGDYELIGLTTAGIQSFFYMIYYTRITDIQDYLKVATPEISAQARVLVGYGHPV